MPPVPQAGFWPQVHTPLVQLSALASQATQATPPVPQLAAEAARQTPLASQQPLGHVVASHTHAPALHSWSAAHALHAAPLEPHCVFVAAMHVLPVPQQPLHMLPPQLQAPFEQESPLAQPLHAPPPVPHAVALCEE